MHNRDSDRRRGREWGKNEKNGDQAAVKGAGPFATNLYNALSGEKAQKRLFFLRCTASNPSTALRLFQRKERKMTCRIRDLQNQAAIVGQRRFLRKPRRAVRENGTEHLLPYFSDRRIGQRVIAACKGNAF